MHWLFTVILITVSAGTVAFTGHLLRRHLTAERFTTEPLRTEPHPTEAPAERQ